ncbi:lipoprotein, partial [Paracraurococcus ruber]|uniref:lipoprotein n=1 Tax=Paracraurococcus ruber TaxID=77675 RepID=UPI00130526CA
MRRLLLAALAALVLAGCAASPRRDPAAFDEAMRRLTEQGGRPAGLPPVAAGLAAL